MYNIVRVTGEKRFGRMNAYRIGPVKYPWPTAFYFSAILLAWALQHLLPLHLPDQRQFLLKLLGAAVGVIGIYLVAYASLMLFRNHTALLANRSAARLVIGGPFRYSRNPIYLGNTLIIMGAGVYIDNGWMMLCALAAAVATKRCICLPVSATNSSAIAAAPVSGSEAREAPPEAPVTLMAGLRSRPRFPP
eukprot:gene1374-1829_t